MCCSQRHDLLKRATKCILAVLQCVANVLKFVAVCCIVLQCVALC